VDLLINTLCSRASAASGRYTAATEALAAAESSLTSWQDRANICTKGLAVLRQLGTDARNRLKGYIEPLAQTGLREIFDPRATFQIDYRALSKAGFAARIVTGIGEQRGAPLATDGNSVAEIVADGILRPLVLCLHRSGGNRICVLDEPYAGVDREHLRPLFRMLQQMGEDLGVQFVIVSHVPPEIVDDLADNVVHVGEKQDDDEEGL
jgi:hypothetical protein